MNSFKSFSKRIYFVSIKRTKHKELFWMHLTNLLKSKKWKIDINEKEKYVKTVSLLSEDKQGEFYYKIDEDRFQCSVELISWFPTELSKEISVLATHLNNHFIRGKVIVDLKNQEIIYELNNDMLINLLYPGEIDYNIYLHFSSSRDSYWAFKKLIYENYTSEIIIDELRNKYEEFYNTN